MKKLMILFVLGLLRLNCGVMAQEVIGAVVPLKVGDRVPEVLLGRDLEFYAGGKVSSVRLSSFSDKLVILDFWATWCKACIPELYRLDSLSLGFAGDFVALPVTMQSVVDMQGFEKIQGRLVHSVVSDKVLATYFPHLSVPHQVWIRKGIVVAIASKAYATAANIRLALSGAALSFREKSEQLDFDSGKPLFIAGNGGDGKELLSQSVIAGYVQGLDNSGERVLQRKGFISLTNGTLMSLYSRALEAQIPFYPVNNRFVIETGEQLRSRILFDGDDAAQENWMLQNAYCYNLVLPGGVSRAELMEIMRSDLDRFFKAHLGVQVSVEKRKVKCRVLKVVGDTAGLVAVSGGRSLPEFIAAYSYANWNLPLPIVDQTGLSSLLRMDIKVNFKDLSAVNAALAVYGLQFSEEIAETNMVIVREVGGGSLLKETIKRER
ncbi:redoxin domain-containing protein [Pedobacter sp. LMG 31464]|uniref:Redoxin domain-containing protein n=1 Tax=Pedobacter planticolens TaxID=2679964 RepID=A0A923ITR1_9SPHI|nr:redoxin domain-containing protein [Pedobacter planticolens]MBB2143938.1 redoxin domain-containing protein [Pedobacter planticolens]